MTEAPPMVASELGTFPPQVIATDISAMVLDVLRVWVPTAARLWELDRELPADSVATPRRSAIHSAVTDGEFTDRTLPSLIVITPNTDGDPDVMLADIAYAAWWRVEVHSVHRGRNALETETNAHTLEGIARTVLLNKSPVGPQRIRWRGVRTDRILDDNNEGRYLLDAVSMFTLLVEYSAIGGAGGPTVPDLPPETYTDGIPIESIDVDVQPIPSTGGQL